MLVPGGGHANHGRRPLPSRRVTTGDQGGRAQAGRSTVILSAEGFIALPRCTLCTAPARLSSITANVRSFSIVMF
ncbi:hypothetical protein E2C01_062771 [Portunus trituberculatus]|uniref:Uncharacterized protein n=1 Tax=Portunus trituberculatus TaxID=210409 RepID=A0A5B7HFT1_PORTR|nr:hypothetical protein [Portunus trituberculatus]